MRKRSSVVIYAAGLVPARGFECHGIGGGFVYFGEVEGVGFGGGLGGALLAISAELGFGGDGRDG